MLKFSIITPTYMQSRYVAHCISSVQSQSYMQYEHLIYDALSSDDTSAVVGSFLEDARIVYRRETDAGPADAINKGLDVARGDIFCWLNSDDCYFDAEVLQRVAQLFERHSEVDVITGCGYFVADDGTLIRPFMMPDPGRISHEGLRGSDYFLQPSTFWRRNTLRLEPRLSYCFDWKLFLDFYAHGLSVLYVPEYFSKYRLQPTSRTMLDCAARKREVVAILRYAGAGRLQMAWATFVYLCYRLSELTGISAVKKTTRSLNFVVHRLSAGRVYSP